MSTQRLDRSGFVKRLVGATTQSNPVDTAGRPMTRANLGETWLFSFFLSNVVFLLYSFFSYCFSWLWTLFKVRCINIRKVFYFIWNPLVYILYVSKKKVIFSMWYLKPFRIYTICSQEKNYVFSMWNLKPFSIYTHMFPIKSYFFNVGFEVISYIYSMFTRKKLCFFNVG